MNVIVHNTAETYHKMIATSSVAERERIFLDELIAPFSDAINRIAGSMPGDMDMMQILKMWKFMMPEDLDTIPPALEILGAYEVWNKSQVILDRCIDCFASYQEQLGLDTIDYGLFLGQQEGSDPLNRGYTGMGGIPGTIFAVYSQPNDYNLSKLSGLVAHEFHHNVQFSIFPWDFMNVTIAQWMIYEGMAESFATELYGEDVLGYYVTDFDMARFDETKTIIRKNLKLKGFNQVRSYIYGDALANDFGFEKVGVPAFAGYAIGYHLVQAYLRKTDQSVVEATFIPADEIIEQSGFFGIE